MAKLKGKFDSMTAETLPEGVERRADTFRISVKVEGEVKYENDEEPFSYLYCTNFPAVLRQFGATLTDDQVTFLGEALSGDATGKAIAAITKVINDDLQDSAAKNQYQKVLKLNSPLTDENRVNARASIVRNFLREQDGMSDSEAIAKLKSFGVIPADFTVELYRANKGKR